MNRREFLQGLALSAAAVAVPSTAAAPTALKAAWVSHYTYVAPDLKKTRDWYHEVFGMQIGHEEAKLSHMWYGDKGGDTVMIIRQAEAGEAAPRIEKFAFTLENFDRKVVEEELNRRGIKAKAEGSRGFWFNDPDGFEIGFFAKNYYNRPKAKIEAPKLWKAISANHIVEYSNNYRKLGDWYKDILSLRQTIDSGRDTYQWFGDTVWIPTAVSSRGGGKTSGELKTLDHVAYTIETFNKEEVLAALNRLNMNPRLDTDLSYNCVDVNGFKTQVCDKQLVPVAEKRPRNG